MITLHLSTKEYQHLVSVLQLDAMKGDKQSEHLFEKLKKTVW